MDAFEAVVGEILRREGYWIQSPFRVHLSKQEKRMIGRPSSPRWELDIVAYKASLNRVLIVECKSYLDSYGVRFGGFDGSSLQDAKRYKLFNDETLGHVVQNRMIRQMVETGLVRKDPDVTFVLACGKIVSESDRERLQAHFDERGWLLWDKRWLQERLAQIATEGYENSPVAVVAKLLLRD